MCCARLLWVWSSSSHPQVRSCYGYKIMEGNTLNLLADLLKQNEGEEEEDNDVRQKGEC